MLTDNLKKYLLIGAGILLLGTGIYYSNKSFVPYKKQVEIAETTLISRSPDIAIKLNEVGRHTTITLTAKDLPGDILAQTRITTGSAEITVDVRKVKLRRDRLEPVIGHEIYHVWEAYYVYGGVDSFCTIVNTEKPTKNWWDRSYEKTAIVRENSLRQYLKEHYYKDYVSMSSTRELQNNKTY